MREIRLHRPQPGPVPEDPWTVCDVELQDLARRHAQAQAQRDDPARGGPGDQIEVVDDANPEVFFEARQHCGGVHAAQAAAVQGQDLESVSGHPEARASASSRLPPAIAR